MKAFILIILILGISAGIFFAGWIQILLPPNTYAVMFSKTNGYETSVIEPGTFAWRWQRLIPTNVTLELYPLKPYSSHVILEGELPSGKDIANLLANGSRFEFHIEFDIIFSIDPAIIPYLAKVKGITSDNLSEWQQQKSMEISQYLHKMLIANCALFECQNRMENFSNVIFEQEINELILTAASQAFQELNIININITKLELPDIEVYQQSRDLYFQLLDQQMQSRLKAVKDMSIERESNSIMYQKQKDNLDLLRNYGSLFEEFPILLKLLELDNNLSIFELSPTIVSTENN